ncbi:hypothetical protein [Leucothrix pacifica]|uniref:DUF4276 domain-containing protein n=1 Tax=Leucothrix pacifica TaxID=1247513 RepID=A0A317CC27_9GAMM|nr:hypothetical protein [Leucothrix pacifica]PWQ95651.1 hypothetical protein DKW60_14645 [Leucothrix pacifica]
MKVAILHEGSEDLKLVKQLASSLGYDFEALVQPFKVGRKSNFFKANHVDYLELVQLVEADQIDKVLFVLDADDPANDRTYGGYENTLTKLNPIIDELGLRAVSQTFICCDPQSRIGNVESLLLSTLDDEKKACIEHFLECSEFGAPDDTKAVLNSIYRKGFPRAPYNYDHEYFDELKEKLEWLLST